MKKMKKLILTSATLLAFASAFLGFSNLNPVTVKAENGISIIGASVRANDPTGIRFHTVVEGGAVEGYSYGTLIIPKADFTGESLTVDTPNVVNVPALRWKSETEFTVALGGVETNGVIANFPKSQYNKDILACSYAQDVNGAYTYTDVTTHTLAKVASVSLTNTLEGGQVTDGTARTFMENICDYVLGEDGFALSQTSVDLTVGDKLTLASLFAETNGNEGLKAVWEVVSGNEYISAEKDDIGAIVSLGAKGAGTAVVKATIGTKTAELTVNAKEREIAANEVVDFKFEGDLELANITNEGDLTGLSFVDEYQGAKGVLKIEANNWGRWGFDSLQPMTAFANYKYLVDRIWVETASADAYLYIKETGVGKAITPIKTGRWVNYYFPGETFIAQWADMGSYYSSMATNRAGSYYIDKIYMTNDMEVIDFAHATDIAAAKDKGSATISYLDEYQGAQGVLKVDAASWGCLGFTPINALADYSEYSYIVLRMNATVTSNLQIAQTNGTQMSEIIPNVWREIYFDAAAFRTQWADAGNYYSALIFKTAGTFYIDEIYMTNEVPETFTVIDFANESYVGSSYLKNQWDATPSYLSEYQGATGVLKVESKNYGCLSFKNLVSLDLCAKFTHLVVRVWIDTPYASSGANTIRVGYGSGETISLESGCWKEYAFDMNGFVKFWKDYGWSDYRASLTFGYASTYYIDCIYAANL